MDDRRLLIFRLEGQRYGLPLGVVREVVRAAAIARLPNGPDVVEGVLNLRGRPVPVLDLRGRLGLPRRPLDAAQHFVVAEVGGRAVAFRVDRADGLMDVEAGAFDTAASVGPGVRHIPRLAGDAGGVIFIHDPERFLSDTETLRLEVALSALP